MEEKVTKQKGDNFLLYIPRRKNIQWEEKKGNVKLIFRHDKAIEKFVRWLVKKPNTSDIEFDRLGSRVWTLIDGNKSIYDIGQVILTEFGSSCEPVYDRLIMYIRYLNRRGWIAFDRGEQK